MELFESLHREWNYFAALHAEFSCNTLQNIPIGISYSAYTIEFIFLIIRVVGYNILKQLAHRINNQIIKILIFADILTNHFAVLGAETVWKRFGVDDINELIT